MKSLEIVNETLKKGDIVTVVTKDYYLVTEEKLETIKQDLEVLEIIRKSHLGDDDIFIRFLIASYMDIDEYNKIKQWLEENEK